MRMATQASKAVYKQLGKSGLRVSVPILGAMSIGKEDSSLSRIVPLTACDR